MCSALEGQSLLPAADMQELADHAIAKADSVSIASRYIGSLVSQTMIDAGFGHFMLHCLLDNKMAVSWSSHQDIRPQRHASSGTGFGTSLMEWMVATLHFQPKAMASITGMSESQIWLIRVIFSARLYEETATLISQVKSKPEIMDAGTRVLLLRRLYFMWLMPMYGAFWHHIQDLAGRHTVAESTNQVKIAGETLRTVLTKMEAGTAPFGTYEEQRIQMDRYALHWIVKLLPQSQMPFCGIGGLSVFSLRVLARIDMAQEPTIAQHPIDQTIKLLTEINAERTKIDALEWEKQHRSLGDLKTWSNYVARLDTIEQSMTACQQAGSSS